MSLDSPHTHIELLWPTKGHVPVQSANGTWSTHPQALGIAEYPLVVPRTDDVVAQPVKRSSVVLTGDRLHALAAARKYLRHAARLVYMDLPRLDGYDESRSFPGPAHQRWSTWLTLVDAYARSASYLLPLDGVLVVQCGGAEAHYARTVLLEVFGHQNDLGEIVWRTHYSPKGGKGSNEVAAVHEHLLCFAADRDALPPLALPKAPEGYGNPDGDPRGPWQARQKDAGRDTAKVKYKLPPYRWELVEGSLPPGLWRVSPFSGVIWGTPTEAGDYSVVVEVEDTAAQKTRCEVQFKVAEEGQPGADESVWWIEDPPTPDDRPPRMGGNQPPQGVVGEPYRFALRAEGGSPRSGEKRPGRGWAFGQQTLNLAILEDRCSFGKKGDAIPQPKSYLSQLEEGMSKINVTSWWDGSDVGWTQDATKHLKNLVDAGHMALAHSTAKPESLLQRLIEIFTAPGDTVVEVFGRSGDLASTALKLGRRFVLTSGRGTTDEEWLEGAVLPRIRAVLAGADTAGASPSTPTGQGEGSSGIRSLLVGDRLADRHQPEEHPALNPALAIDGLAESVLYSEGYLVTETDDSGVVMGRSWNGEETAFALQPDAFLTPPQLVSLIGAGSATEDIVIYYFRSSEDVDPTLLPENVTLRRVPMQLTQ